MRAMIRIHFALLVLTLVVNSGVALADEASGERTPVDLRQAINDSTSDIASAKSNVDNVNDSTRKAPAREDYENIIYDMTDDDTTGPSTAITAATWM